MQTKFEPEQMVAFGGEPQAHSLHPSPLVGYSVIRRNGESVVFEPGKIARALTGAFLAVHGPQNSASTSTRETIGELVIAVVHALRRSRPHGGAFHIEEVQDQVELALMRGGHHKVARAYVLYRDRHAEERNKEAEANYHPVKASIPALTVVDGDVRRPLDLTHLKFIINSACANLGDDVKSDPILVETQRNLYEGVSIEEIYKASILAARTLVERDPGYSRVAARLLMHTIRKEILGEEVLQQEMASRYKEYFGAYIRKAVTAELLDPVLMEFDLERLGNALDASRDQQFDYLGMQTLYDRYLLALDDHRIELPQAFFMRVAMGLAIKEVDREARAIEFYHALSSFDFMCSTPALFNSGSRRSQLSSCYLTSIPDDLGGIFDCIKENAMLSKYGAGLGNAWTNVRALGSHIKGNNGKTQGLVPFLKIANDVASAIDQGGKRRGAFCAYLETWHSDIEEFLELRKNTGDDRRRTHDMNTANWIPDLFMKRVLEGMESPGDEKKGKWTLFSPDTCPDLHDLFGSAFEHAYVQYEARAARGEIRGAKTVVAKDLWRKMLSMLFETGHPWITFKDACNVRSPQQHAGVIHSSNLCSEITLNTSEDEIAVCNLGSVNLVRHLKENTSGGKVLDQEKLKKTIRTGMRILDNVIDLNYYVLDHARNATIRHRPVGLGIMGYQDALHEMRIPFGSKAALNFADSSMEAVCYYAYWTSTELAQERGSYPSYMGSLWERGVLPKDTLDLLSNQRGGFVEVDRSSTMDWDSLREQIHKCGMRNSNCTAIAPTATISNIIGVSASIEPSFGNLSVKSNLSGEFTILNEYLVRDLKKLDLWDDAMVMDLKYFDGSIQSIDRIPQELKDLYATAFEIGTTWVIEAAARRQKWLDQSQSLNIFMAGASGKKLHETYTLAWLRGLKTTYYLRTISATQAEKSTVSKGKLNAVESLPAAFSK